MECGHEFKFFLLIHHGFYCYLFRFVNLLRAKTPKVTFYSEKAKCLLMENDPDPDFEVCFYEGKQLYSEVYFLCK